MGRSKMATKSNNLPFKDFDLVTNAVTYFKLVSNRIQMAF